MPYIVSLTPVFSANERLHRGKSVYSLLYSLMPIVSLCTIRPAWLKWIPKAFSTGYALYQLHHSYPKQTLEATTQSHTNRLNEAFLNYQAPLLYYPNNQPIMAVHCRLTVTD